MTNPSDPFFIPNVFKNCSLSLSRRKAPKAVDKDLYRISPELLFAKHRRMGQKTDRNQPVCYVGPVFRTSHRSEKLRYLYSGWGDHIQLLQIYELWDQTDYDVDWCKDNNLQVRGMKFVGDVRKQLSQIMQKIAKGSLDVRTNERRKESQEDYRNLRKSLSVGYASQLAERMIRHNGYRTLGFKPQLVQVHPSSVLRTDEEGMLPNYVVYHELISTSRPFMQNVCAVEMGHAHLKEARETKHQQTQWWVGSV